VQYLGTGASNPLPGEGYCEICKKWDHHSIDYPLLQKYQSTPRNVFCNFCKSMRLDEKDCRTFNLMREHTSYMYMILEENVAVEGGGPKYNTQRGFNPGRRGNFGRGRGRRIICRGGQGPIIFYNCKQPRHLSHECLNPCTMYTYYKSLDHASEYCPQLITK
jgi:hypothetical protein